MKFGRVERPEEVNFILPSPVFENQLPLSELALLDFRIGTMGFSAFKIRALDKKQGIYHPLIKYEAEFNSIELNASYTISAC